MNLLKRVSVSMLLLMFPVIIWAQDKKVDININTDKGREWYEQPWAWVIGGAIFILLLVALLRGGRRTAS